MFFLLLQMQKSGRWHQTRWFGWGWCKPFAARCNAQPLEKNNSPPPLPLGISHKQNSEIQKMICCGLWTLDCGYVRGSSVQLNCPALRNSWSHVPLITVASAGPLRNPGAARLQSIISARGPSTAASQVQFEWLPLSVRTTLQLQYQRAAPVRNCCHLRQQDVFFPAQQTVRPYTNSWKINHRRLEKPRTC